MEKQEFITFATALKNYYPRDAVLPNTEAMDAWYEVLSDLEYDLAMSALKNWVRTQRWAPTIADIRQQTEHEKCERFFERILDN